MESLKKRPAVSKLFEYGKFGYFLNFMKAITIKPHEARHRFVCQANSSFTDKQRKHREIRNKIAYRSRRVNRLRGA